MAGGGQSGGGGGQQTVTQVQQIPAWEQGYAQTNQNIAASLASQPYPTYQGQLVANFTPQQTAGMQQAGQAATAFQPDLNTAEGMTGAASQQWSPQAAGQYMSPYAMAAMAPQLQQLGLQQAGQQKQIDAQATQAGAFGDARHGVADALNNFYGNLAQNDIVSQGMNSAYGSGLNAFQQDQSRLLGAGQQMGQLGSQEQGLGISGANALMSAGTQQQQLMQQELNTAYTNFMNQQNWGPEQLNLRMAALANSPYNTTLYQSLPPPNATASGVGAFSALAGGLGNLMGGGSKGNTTQAGGNVFGGGA